MGTYDIQLEQTGSAPDWTLLVLCAIAAVLGLVAAVVVVPQFLAAVRGERADVGRTAAGNRVGLAMATLLSAVLVVGGIIGVVVSLTAEGLYHASGLVEATGTVDGQRWLKIAEMPFAVAWEGGELQDGDRVGAACTEGSAVPGLDWTCAPAGN